MALRLITLLLFLAANNGLAQIAFRALAGQNRLPPAAGAGYTAYATTFAGDGQCWMERDAGLTDAVDAKTGTISFWIKYNGDDGVANQIFQGGSGRPSFNRQAANTIRFSIFDAAGTTEIIRINSTIPVTNDGNWHHIISSWDIGTTNKGYMYIDGTDRTSRATWLFETNFIDYTRVDWSVGGAIGETGTSDVNGCLSEFWFSTNYVDITQATELQKFRSAGGIPVSLGSDGSTPTGNQPIIYFRATYESWTNNYGYGGNFVKKGTTAFTSCTAP